MSIGGDLQIAIGSGALAPLPMRLDSDAQVRTMLLSKEVRELVLGPYRSRAHEARAGLLWADMESFVRGGHVSICLTPKKAGKHAKFGLLDPISAATWDFRNQVPSPSLRVLGHFESVDRFVALTWWPKRVLVDWSQKEPLGVDVRRWRDAITECNERWYEILPNSVPVSGLKGDSYVSSKFHIV